jgi:tRNA threonylcarbamoyl adenosine modification protein YeaZ
VELILDASSSSARVGLAVNGLLRWMAPPLPPLEHTRELLPAIMQGLETVHTGWHDLQLIVVALGPGPFNGLRVAVSTAKGLAAGTGASTVGIATLRAEVERCACSGKVRPIIAAGRTTLATALYSWSGGDWRQEQETRLVEEDDAVELLDAEVLLCGEIERFVGALPPGHGALPRVADTHASRLDSLALLGWQRYASGNVTDAAALQPLYARPPHITTPRDRRP